MTKNPNDALIELFGKSGYPKCFDQEYAPSWESAGPEYREIPASPEARISQVLGFADLLSRHGVKLMKSFKLFGLTKFDPRRLFAELLYRMLKAGCEDFLQSITRMRLLQNFEIETTYSFFTYNGAYPVLTYNVVLKPRKGITADQALSQYEGSLYPSGQIPFQLREQWTRSNAKKSALLDARDAVRAVSNASKLPLLTKTVNEGIASVFASRCAKDRLLIRLVYAPAIEFPSRLSSRAKKQQACTETLRRVLRTL